MSMPEIILDAHVPTIGLKRINIQCNIIKFQLFEKYLDIQAG